MHMAEEVEDLVRALYRLGLVRREIARHALAELGSHGFTALAVIKSAGAMRVSDIAERLGIDVSVASRQVNALITAGYVSSERDATDGRAYRITTTDAGAKVLTESHRRMVATFSRALEGWSTREIAELAERLDLLREDFSTSTHPAQGASE